MALPSSKKGRPLGRPFARQVADGSVFRDDRAPVAAETVVDPQREQIDILADAVDRIDQKGIRDREGIVRVTHEEAVVFDTERPVRREAVFPAHAYGTTPLIGASRRNEDAARVGPYVISISYRRCAAFQIEQRGIPGISDLTGDQPHS